jgi:hypothetical protein
VVRVVVVVVMVVMVHVVMQQGVPRSSATLVYERDKNLPRG